MLGELLGSSSSETEGESVDALKPETSLEEIWNLVGMVPGFGWAAWPDGEFIGHSKSMEDHVGVPTTKLASRDENGDFSWKDTVHPEDYERLATTWMEAVRAQRTFDVSHRVKTASGEFRWLRSTAKAQMDETGCVKFWLGTSIDIHDAMEAMKASEEREREMRALINTVPAPIWSTDANGEPTDINRALAEQTGISMENLQAGGKSVLAEAIFQAIHPDDRTMVGEALIKSFSTGERFKLKYRQRRADGHYGWISGEADALRDHTGKITRWFGVCHDIDEEVAARLGLAEREARLALVVNMMPGLVWVSSPDGMPTYFSKRLEEWIGFKVDDLVGTPDDRLQSVICKTVHPEDQEQVSSTLRSSYETGEPWSLRFRQRHVDGAWRWLEARMEPLMASDGSITQWIGLQVDIENEVRTQESLRLAQDKLARAAQHAGMAELSASIAHEVSQPLAAVIMSSNACRRWLAMDPPNIDRARLSAESSVRDANIASDVVKRIRALFHHNVEDQKPDDINKIAKSVRDLVAEEVSSAGIRLDLDLGRRLPLVLVDNVQLQQVLRNLIRNAAEAIQSQSAGERQITLRTAAEDRGVLVEIADTGGGFDDVDRIFMPFFTTKESGMGMGLSICQTIVAAHGGKIWAENVDGGARMCFSLPKVEPEIAHEQPVAP